MNEQREMTKQQISDAREYGDKLDRLEKILAESDLDTIKGFLESENGKIRIPNGETLLHLAAANKDPRVILHLIEDEGFDPNVEMSNGMTPILLAAKHKNIVGIITLLSKGADPHRKNTLGKDVLGVLEMHGVNEKTLQSVAELIAKRHVVVAQVSKGTHVMFPEPRPRYPLGSDEKMSLLRNRALPRKKGY